MDKQAVVVLFDQRSGPLLKILSSAHAVALFEKFIGNRPPSMCLPESPFYLAINCQASDKCWGKRQPMGQNKIGTIMNTLTEKGNLRGKKTNHSARKTMTTLLSKQNIPDTQIQQLSGHKNTQSLNSYSTSASLQQQKQMS